MVAQDTKSRKSAEYQPSEWMARRLSPSKIETINKSTGARLTFIVAFGRLFGCESDQSGEYHDMPAGSCDCHDQGRAIRAQRMCRHQAAWERVCWLLENERDAAGFRAAAINPQKFDARVAAAQAETESGIRQQVAA